MSATAKRTTSDPTVQVGRGAEGILGVEVEQGDKGAVMKRQQGSAADRPIIAVSKVQIPDNEDWYTPQVLKLSPLNISVTLGTKGKGRVRCEIEESEWERRHVDVRLNFERIRYPDGRTDTPLHSNVDDEFGSGVAGTFPLEQIDRLIQVLTVARNEAEKRGLFTPRPTPTSVEQILAAGRSAEG